MSPTKEQIKAAEAVVGRLGQMRELWEDAAREYFQPPRFLLHLQNCISVSRTVTFILQKQKAALISVREDLLYSRDLSHHRGIWKRG